MEGYPKGSRELEQAENRQIAAAGLDLRDVPRRQTGQSPELFLAQAPELASFSELATEPEKELLGFHMR
jgi:hypothetical protein